MKIHNQYNGISSIYGWKNSCYVSPEKLIVNFSSTIPCLTRRPWFFSFEFLLFVIFISMPIIIIINYISNFGRTYYYYYTGKNQVLKVIRISKSFNNHGE